MLKMNLRICAENVDVIKEVLSDLSKTRLESNAAGDMFGTSYDYDFVKSDYLYSKDDMIDIVNPETYQS
jgi:hypothetical protein